MDTGELSLGGGITLFVAAALAVGVSGWKMAQVADRLADRVGWGEAFVGGLFVGGATSLSGLVTTWTAAWGGHPQLAVSHAVGGIAAQTAFIVVADLFLRRVNLEHAAASLPNLVNCSVLIVLLGITLTARLLPEFDVAGVHPASVVTFSFYLFGLTQVKRMREKPMWLPKSTRDTIEDRPESINRRLPLRPLWLRFAALAGVLGTSGWALAKASNVIITHSGLSETMVGATFTAIATSLPELVTAVVAVRQGALTLAVGDIIGGNSFDIIQLVIADIGFRQGSILHAVGPGEAYLLVITLVMTAILTFGLLIRQRSGWGNIGIEGVLIVLFYAVGIFGISVI